MLMRDRRDCASMLASFHTYLRRCRIINLTLSTTGTVAPQNTDVDSEMTIRKRLRTLVEVGTGLPENQVGDVISPDRSAYDEMDKLVAVLVREMVCERTTYYGYG